MNFRMKTVFIAAITALVTMICSAAFDARCIDGIILYFLLYVAMETNRMNDRLDKMEG